MIDQPVSQRVRDEACSYQFVRHWRRRIHHGRLAKDTDWLRRDSRARPIDPTRDSGPLPPSGWPEELSAIEREIVRSRVLLDLTKDWDGEGSEGYAEQTWRRAAKIVRQQALATWETQHAVIPTPRIVPGPQGSIDIHWQSESFELLINVPSDPSVAATFYGDDYGRATVKGELDPSTDRPPHVALSAWLMRE